MHFHPLTSSDKDTMLKEIGVRSFDELLRAVPKSIQSPEIKIPEALSESELQSLFTRLGQKNKNVKETLSFLGGGSYEHFIPAAVSSVTGRHEFYTAYTPYQPEASQGTLQAIFEFQSMVSELMGLEVSNASHYDGATSLADAALLALRHTGRNRILVSRSVHPHYRKVLHTYLEGSEFQVKELPVQANGSYDKNVLTAELDEHTAGVILQTPNFFGTVEDFEGVSGAVHAAGALLILSVNPLSLGVIKSPGEWNADIAVGEGQSLGIPLQFGGPYLGLFTTTRTLMRKMPGRLAGITADSAGRRAYCLTLQAREQHIRREKAFSNICTNQALCALAACVYMTLLGKKGIREVGELNIDRAYALREKISKVPGFHVREELPVFNEFVVQTDKDVKKILERMETLGIFAGIDLGPYYREFQNHMLVCATETKTEDDLNRYVEALRSC